MHIYEKFFEESVKYASLPHKPEWLKVPKTHGDTLFSIKRQLRSEILYTVCEEAKCPNIAECWNAGTATFMLLGDTCTRFCRFCNVKTGNPEGKVDENEPDKVAQVVESRGIDYIVLTMVDRDDLPDGGAAHVARTIRTLQERIPHAYIEVLAGDFAGNRDSLTTILTAGKGLDVFAHNLETVARTTPRIRDARASYAQSLQVLQNAKEIAPHTFTKSGLMLGLGEKPEEVEETLHDMRKYGVEIVTLGQYLRPTPQHAPVKRYVTPEEFAFWKEKALELGFKAVASGPLVRSSYRAAHLFPKKLAKKIPTQL